MARITSTISSNPSQDSDDLLSIIARKEKELTTMKQMLAARPTGNTTTDRDADLHKDPVNDGIDDDTPEYVEQPFKQITTTGNL